MSTMEASTCDWCLREAPVQLIQEKLWRFWKLISAEDPNLSSHKNICGRCKSRYEDFSVYIGRCKIHATIIDKILSGWHIEDEPLIDNVYRPLITEEISNEEESDFNPGRDVFESQGLPVGLNIPDEETMKKSDEEVPSFGKIKEERSIDIEDHFIIDEDVQEEETSDSDYGMDCDKNGKFGLVLRVVIKREVLTGSMILQKKAKAKVVCSYCSKTFRCRSQMKIHLRIHTGEKPYKCSHCDKSFAQHNSLNNHLRIHTGKRPFKCSHCDKTFSRSHHLKRHLYIHMCEKPFKCSHCDKSFTENSTLNDHLRTHRAKKRFKCSHCDKAAADCNPLICTHTATKPFKCSHCSKSFSHSSYLTIHLRTHTNDKPFQCSHCDMRFIRSDRLKRHLRTHTGERPFKCSHCNKTFGQYGRLKSHIRTHTGEKPFKCSHCARTFSRSDGLQAHLFRIHKTDHPF